MLRGFIKRCISAAAAIALLTTNILPSASLRAEDGTAPAETQADTVPATEDAELCHQSIELYPNGETSEQVVTLAGMMPEGAVAEAVDVSQDYNDDPDYGWQRVDSMQELAEYAEYGIYLSHIDGYFLTDHQETISGTRTGITKTKPAVGNGVNPENAYRELNGDTYYPAKYYFRNAVLNDAGTDTYKLCADSRKYLRTSDIALSLVDTDAAATVFQVKPNADGSLCLFDGSHYVSFTEDGGYSVSDTPTPLNLVQLTDVNENHIITYTANRISVSDGSEGHACDGNGLIVYTRVWNNSQMRYDYYAIDHDGSLHQVFAYGDKIMWLGDAVETLWWKLTVYEDADGKETGYYELQNTYSGKYLAPQLTGGQVLSDTKIGIQLQGRKYEVTDEGRENLGEYYSTITAWDARYYDYAALQAVVTDEEAHDGEIRSTSFALSDTFYFAVPDEAIVEENTARLHEVDTIDSMQYGVTMRLIDFSKVGDKSEISTRFFGGNVSDRSGLLSNHLDANGHPTAAYSDDATQIGSDFGADFNDAVYVNHLFINSVHESSGYFEFDSTQNFATVMADGGLTQQTDDSGHPVAADGQLTTDASTDGVPNQPIYDFTVYRELGTTDNGRKDSLRHGDDGEFCTNAQRPGRMGARCDL